MNLSDKEKFSLRDFLLLVCNVHLSWHWIGRKSVLTSFAFIRMLKSGLQIHSVSEYCSTLQGVMAHDHPCYTTVKLSLKQV